MPTIERPRSFTRPEKSFRPEPSSDVLPELEPGGSLLKIDWNIQPVEAREVQYLFGGLVSLLNEIARAVLRKKFPELEVNDEDDVLEIEVLELELHSIMSTLRVAFKKTGKLAKNPLVNTLLSAVVSYLLSALDPLASLHKKPDPLPAAPQQKIEAQVNQFKETLQRSGKSSQLIVRAEATNDSIKLDFPT